MIQPYIFLSLIYLKCREKVLFAGLFPNVHNSQGWVGLKPGAG